MELNDSSLEAEATQIDAKTIKAIDKTTVHKICSGQVVLTLATAVKELVENSIDAGSSCVEIRLKDHGSTLIEVSDNGKGVEPCDFEGLTLKHHTSKLQDFGDLIGVKTFGFRGEALSSLCALSHLSVVTRHNSQTVGTKLVYNTNGKLVEKTPVSRQIGTTVCLENLFHTLPVRHKEFLRNLKKEFNKMVHVLYSYCLVTTNVRILCTNQSGKGTKTVVVSTESHSSLRENISSIFGPKQVSSLLEIKQKNPSEEILSEYGIDNIFSQEEFRLEGFVSSCAHGKGRSCSDRQFFFINNRPCDPAKVVRVVNEVYHHYNRHQFPMIVLKVQMAEGDVDVNVTPDKRQVLVSREKLLLATIKTTLICLYETIPSTLDTKNSPLSNFNSIRGSYIHSGTPKASPATPKLSFLSQRFSRSPSESPLTGKKGATNSYAGVKRALSSQGEFNGGAKQPKLQDFSFMPVSSNTTSNEIEKENQDFGGNHRSCSPNPSLTPPNSFEESVEGVEHLMNEEISEETEGKLPSNSLPNVKEEIKSSLEKEGSMSGAEHEVVGSSSPKPQVPSASSPTLARSHGPAKQIHSKTDAFLVSLKARKSISTLPTEKTQVETIVIDESEISTKPTSLNSDYQNGDISECKVQNGMEDEFCPVVLFDDNHTLNKSNGKNKENRLDHRKSVTVPFSLASIQRKLATKRRKLEEKKDVYRKFRAQIAPSDNATAEEELKKEINKESFKKMSLVGQFNLGFIVARLHSDLFIIDQHATDEKYNFESLQKSCVLQNQKLIIPQTLELTAASEAVLLDNLEIFIKNGFEFKHDETKEVGRRVLLTSMPHSKGWEFKKEDIEEMIFMLEDSPGVMCRPSRVSAMFASRACRQSVMIGTHLSFSQMRRLVNHMEEMDQPWNCPHGRPTIRHLINLSLLAKLN